MYAVYFEGFIRDISLVALPSFILHYSKNYICIRTRLIKIVNISNGIDIK